MFRSLFILAIVAVLFGSFISSCTYDHQESLGCNGNPDTISFSANVLPIFRTNCATVLCHSGIEPMGNLNLEDGYAYAQLTREGSGYINTDVPEHSILYSQLNSLTLPMPPEGKLDPCSIELILKWVQQGAPNN